MTVRFTEFATRWLGLFFQYEMTLAHHAVRGPDEEACFRKVYDRFDRPLLSDEGLDAMVMRHKDLLEAHAALERMMEERK